MSPKYKLPSLLLLLASLSAPLPAGAQDIVTAEALFHSGLDDMEAGRYEKGCKALAESQRLDPRLGTLFTLATCEERWGHIATAVIRFEDFIVLYERLPEDRKAVHAARHKVAVETRDKLRPDVPHWTLSLPAGSPPGTVVKRDGEVVPEPALGLSVPVDPGEHTVSTQAPGGPLLEKKITIARGQTLTLTLEIAPAPPPSAPSDTAAPVPTSAPVEGGQGSRRVAVYLLGGAGVASVVVGGVLGGLVLGQKSVVDGHCGAAIGQSDKGACDATGLAAARDGQAFGTGSTVGFIAGGALLGAALVVLLTEPKGGSASPGGARVSAGALRLGPGGAVFGVKGAF